MLHQIERAQAGAPAPASAAALLFDWVAPVTLFRLLGNVNAGVQPAMAGRTAEFDAQVQTAVEAGCKQYVILGAGYDTRGLRLNLPPDVNVFEVDQPKVQQSSPSAQQECY